MKPAILSLLVFVTIVTFYSCDQGNIEGKSQVIQDSLATIFPTWQAAKIKIGDNNTSMSVVIGDATFYKATDDTKREKANALGKMVLRILGKNFLDKGDLIVTADIHNTSENPVDGIRIPIDFAELKKAQQ